MNNEKKVVLLTGYKRSGKDTFANILKRELNGKIFKLAKPLREMVKDFLDINDNFIEEQKERKPFYFKNGKKLNYLGIDMSIRDLMILLSEGAKKYYGQEIFCKNVVNEIKKSNKEYCIVSDLRYPYEADFFKKYFSNVLIVRIYRKGITLSSTHSSETSIDLIKPDIVINNNRNINYLKNFVDKIISYYKNKGYKYKKK